jgi:isopenicillin-N epimerase
MVKVVRDQFLLRPDVVYLNHGSFGACPKPVFAAYQNWQLELERQPVEFLFRRGDALLDQVRAALGQYVGAPSPDDLIFVPNATTGVNIVARSLPLRAGDEVLGTSHEYGACEYAWQFACAKTGARYVRADLPLPLTTPEDFIEQFWSAVAPQTRVIFISHISSPTGLIFPIDEICRRARAAGILTVVDGAHAPGQVAVDIAALDPDFYTGNCHKWMCAPKGSAFLYARREHQLMLEPMIVSWGWVPTSTFVQRHQWQGTRDIAAFVTVPTAIEFQAAHDWDRVRAECHALACEMRDRLLEVRGVTPLTSRNDAWLGQMCAVILPPCDAVTVKTRLYDEHCVEVPITVWEGRAVLRVSFQAYNTRADADALLDALGQVLAD